MNETTQQPNPASGLSGVKKEHIDSRIADVRFQRVEGTTMTLCFITMKNNFMVVGQSACVDPYGFDEEIGRSIAYDNAFRQLWTLEGYLLAERRLELRGV
jgi:hypothetical protein